MEHLNFGGMFFCATLQAMLVGCPDECLEQRMRLKWLRLELGMELASDEIRMLGNFDHFDVSAIWG